MNLRDLERDSIRAFVQRAADDGYLSGRVLDYGCGKQPYRDIVEAAGGEYVGFDMKHLPANTSGEDLGHHWTRKVPYDAVLCTQVVQYVLDPPLWMREMYWLAPENDDPRRMIRKDGHLILTYPTNWPEVEPEDLHRFTKAGMERLLTEAGFEVLVHEPRVEFLAAKPGGHYLNSQGQWLYSGYGVIARA